MGTEVRVRNQPRTHRSGSQSDHTPTLRRTHATPGDTATDSPGSIRTGTIGDRLLPRPGVRRRMVRFAVRLMRDVSFTGWFLALAAFALSVTPSLLPRAWYLQGVISGLLVTITYGTGAAAAWLARCVWPRSRRRWRLRVVVFRTAVVATIVTLPLFGYLGARWQGQVRASVGLDPSDSHYYGLTLLIAAGFLWTARAAGRLLRWSARTVGRRLSRWIPPPTAKILAVAVVAAITMAAVNEALMPLVARVANASFSLTDSGTPKGAIPRSVPQRSGSPESAIRWADLGYEGRSFIAAGPTAPELTAFSGRSAAEPIRAYVGLKSADTLAQRAELAVRELVRSGGFDRSVLAVVSPTGRGWINHSAAAALEYLWNGDTAIVAMQYSYLSSAAAFLTDLQTPADAARALFDAVHAEWAKLPATRRPKLITIGESLGAFASQAPFDNVDEVLERTDGALWVGGPAFTPLWQQVTGQSRPRTSIQHPVIDDCTTICFATRADDIPADHHPEVMYIQHVNDPVVWWSPDLLFHKPSWLSEPPLPGRNPLMRWIPLITFWQITADMAVAAQTPDGQGHYYGQIYADALAALVPPPGWGLDDTNRLRDLIAYLDTGI